METRPNNYGGKIYLRSHFHNSEHEARGTLVFYTNKTAGQLNMILTVIGPYKFGSPSKDVFGATEADFDFTKFVITPKSETMVNILNDSRPTDSKLKAWVLNEPQTVDTSIEEGIFGMVAGKFFKFASLLKSIK